MGFSIHRLAEEFALWSTIIVNCSIIGSAIGLGVIFARVKQVHVPVHLIRATVVTGVLCPISAVFLITTILAIISKILLPPDPRYPLPWSHLAFWTACAVGLALLAYRSIRALRVAWRDYLKSEISN